MRSTLLFTLYASRTTGISGNGPRRQSIPVPAKLAHDVVEDRGGPAHGLFADSFVVPVRRGDLLRRRQQRRETVSHYTKWPYENAFGGPGKHLGRDRDPGIIPPDGRFDDPEELGVRGAL